jgi:hypothetical protein
VSGSHQGVLQEVHLNKFGFTTESRVVKSCVPGGIDQVDPRHSAKMKKEVYHLPMTPARH